MIPTPAPIVPGIPRRLVIVRQDHLALYRYLSQRLTDVANVEVVLDRRQAATPAPGETVAERRQPLARRERDRWWSFGYRLADEVGAEPGASGATGPPHA